MAGTAIIPLSRSVLAGSPALPCEQVLRGPIAGYPTSIWLAREVSQESFVKPQQLQDSSYTESNPTASHRLCAATCGRPLATRHSIPITAQRIPPLQRRVRPDIFIQTGI